MLELCYNNKKISLASSRRTKSIGEVFISFGSVVAEKIDVAVCILHRNFENIGTFRVTITPTILYLQENYTHRQTLCSWLIIVLNCQPFLWVSSGENVL